MKEAFGDSYTEHVKITLKNSDNLRMSAVYPPESSQDPAKGTLIQGYAMLNLNVKTLFHLKKRFSDYQML